MTKTSQKTVLLTITEMYDKIFQAEKKVADFILQNPDLAVNANVSELANYSGVSDATVIRLCKHLGYEGYYQMKICLSRDIGRRDLSLKRENPINTSMAGCFKEMAEGIISAGAAIDENVFRKSMELLKNSTMIHLVAAGNTAPLCLYCGYRLERIGIRSSYNMQPEYYMNHINLAQSTDVVLAVSWSGTSRTVVQALEMAKEKGMKTVAVTGYRYSPVSRIADYLLLSASGDGEVNKHSQYSRLSEMAVLEVLIQALESSLSIEKDEFTEPEILLSETKY